LTSLVAIAVTVRCEAPFLLEWIAYHRTLGIEAFLLADNGGDDGTSALLQDLHSKRIVFRLDWIGQKYFQLAFYRQAIEIAHRFARGLFFIDVDEFLRPSVEATSISDLTRLRLTDDSIGAVAMNWAVYGSSNQRDIEPGLVIEQFTRRAHQETETNRHVKTFVRLDRCAGPGPNPHAVNLASGRYVDTRGGNILWAQKHHPVGLTTQVVWDHLRADRFVLKSRAEFERKRQRGSAFIRLRMNKETMTTILPRKIEAKSKTRFPLLLSNGQKSRSSACATSWPCRTSDKFATSRSIDEISVSSAPRGVERVAQGCATLHQMI
jgi:hypothetical protein